MVYSKNVIFSILIWTFIFIINSEEYMVTFDRLPIEDSNTSRFIKRSSSPILEQDQESYEYQTVPCVDPEASITFLLEVQVICYCEDSIYYCGTEDSPSSFLISAAKSEYLKKMPDWCKQKIKPLEDMGWQCVCLRSITFWCW